MLLLLPLAVRALHAQDASTAAAEPLSGEVVRIDSDAGHVVQVTWSRDEHDAIRPDLILSGTVGQDVDVVLTFRASFADRLTTWTLEPVWVDSDTSTTVSVSIPGDVKWAEQQDNYFTDLEISVVSYDVTGASLRTTAGPRIKMLWSGTEFTFLDLAQAKALAPYGYVREAPPGAEALIEELGTTNVEFGPGL
jgi:hypothetical protein